MKPTQILLTFADKETADYVKMVCRRKGISIPDYIVENFDWDSMPDCIEDSAYDSHTCYECEYNERCPDVKKKEPRWAKRGTASRIIPRSGR